MNPLGGPNCYACRHRSNLPGDTHSACGHPDASLLVYVGLNPLGISADDIAQQRGWFMWPLNYDPLWLKSCNGFNQK